MTNYRGIVEVMASSVARTPPHVPDAAAMAGSLSPAWIADVPCVEEDEDDAEDYQ